MFILSLSTSNTASPKCRQTSGHGTQEIPVLSVFLRLAGQSLTARILNLEETSINATVEHLVHCNQSFHNDVVVLNSKPAAKIHSSSWKPVYQSGLFPDKEHLFDYHQSIWPTSNKQAFYSRNRGQACPYRQISVTLQRVFTVQVITAEPKGFRIEEERITLCWHSVLSLLSRPYSPKHWLFQRKSTSVNNATRQ